MCKVSLLVIETEWAGTVVLNLVLQYWPKVTADYTYKLQQVWFSFVKKQADLSVERVTDRHTTCCMFQPVTFWRQTRGSLMLEMECV